MTLQMVNHKLKQTSYTGQGSASIDAITIRAHQEGYVADVIIDNISYPLSRHDSNQPLVFSTIHDLKTQLGNANAHRVTLITEDVYSQV